MSIEKQYYTPSLKEFHQGFRYEINWNNMRFDKEVFGLSGLTLEGISQRIKSGLITVKSLDHDDIIEAGWKESNEDTLKILGRIYYTLGKYECFYEDNILTVYHQYAEQDQFIFVGKIKNYNKLLDVMEMLGINANS